MELCSYKKRFKEGKVKFRFVNLFLSILLVMNCNLEGKKLNFHSFQVQDIKGNTVDLSRYKGKPILVVNVASRCGFTPQYEGLEELYKKYKDKGLAIIGFPANNFGAQEPGTNEEIAEFCRFNYGVTFDMMAKISVKGKDMHPVYEFLINNAPEKGDVKWNFEKFLIGKDGTVKARFRSATQPQDPSIIQAIEKELAAGS